MTSSVRDWATLSDVYTAEAVEAIAAKTPSSNGFKTLHRVLTATGENVETTRSHLAKYLRFAQLHNGLDADRLKRLREPADYAAWHAVYNELLVAYFVAKRFALQVSFVVNPSKKGEGDFYITHSGGCIIVEAKTPKGDNPELQGPTEEGHDGWDDDLVRTAFLQGASQLEKGKCNLIVICTQLCAWIHDWTPLERLLYGQEVITGKFDSNERQITGLQTEFRPDGELLRHTPKRYTRISAVASFRTDTYCGGAFHPHVMQVQFAVLHNYFATCCIPPKLFSAAEQFVPDRDKTRIKHINEKRSTLLFYMGADRLQDSRTRVKLALHRPIRRLRRLHYRLRISRTLRTATSQRRDRHGQ